DLAFDPNDPQSVVVTLQVQPGLNIREDSVASIESQGLTGATYVEISGGTKNSPILEAKSGQRYPVIPAKQSTLQQLEQSAPELVAKLNVAADHINNLLSDANRKSVTDILTNLDKTTTALAARSQDLDDIIRNTNTATANLADVSRELKPTLASVDLTVKDADGTVKKFGKLSDDADAFVNGDGLAQISDLIGDLRRLVVNL